MKGKMKEPNATVTEALQQSLVDLIALELQSKQAHWNIRGASFRALHLALDEVVDKSRELLDEVAERIAQIGACPDGRPETVARTTVLDEIDGGILETEKAYVLMAEKVQRVSDQMKAAIDPVDEVDHVSGDILIASSAALDMQAWLLRSATE